jgi:hypothetical protein
VRTQREFARGYELKKENGARSDSNSESERVAAKGRFKRDP